MTAPGNHKTLVAAKGTGSPSIDRRARPPRHLADFAPAERREWVAGLGQPPMRAGQLARHYFARLETAPERMTDLPASGRADIVGRTLPTLLTPLAERRADGGRTVKALWGLTGGVRVETVLMAYPDRVTVCVSTQAGCGMGCPFCATGKLGLARNLSAAEIVEQVRLAAVAAANGALGGQPRRLTNVVLMGMGEPLANFRATQRALSDLTDPAPSGMGLAARNVTVSTCGLVPAIDRLAQEGPAVRLALSLHAPDDELRDRLVPVNRRYPVAEALDAARRYFDATGRRVSIEYALMRGVNDQSWRAGRLAKELNRRGSGWAHVNPIPLNPVEGSEWTASYPEVEAEFVAHLRGKGIVATLRDTRGADIDGACGQLAARVAGQRAAMDTGD
ncbi:MAG: 23S rRNA (adenine(2503)-C(2))-methyltransferase RlmN [Bifidobacteriaceae bacterium]|jgi:23S rRNA (adenine2503-C2)-methyltransferase|nr:23S rRNA (adenine(2503)-C(2))-methyltransferase RlmN [Bifidobacteriaceae bacterium]